jgi:proton glutamate symport protein
MINRVRGLLARLPRPAWMLFAIILGFGCGALLGSHSGSLVGGSRLLGGLWIDALRMTILPLVFALVVTGVADLTMNGDHAGRRIGRRLPVVLVSFLLISAIVASLIVPPLLAEFPLPAQTAAAFRAGVPAASPLPSPSVADTLRMMVPVNVFASAAQGAIVPLVIFALVFGVAISRIDRTRAAMTLGLFRSLADAMLVVVGWVLRVAPFGVFALALVIGATAGLNAAVALGHYILVQVIVAVVLALISYLLVPVFSNVSLLRFARAVAPAQAVAAGTQSSIATLPAMLVSAERIGVPERHAAVILSLAVAVFKVTSPSGALLFGLSAAWLAGIDVSMSQVIVAIPMSLLATLLVLGVPGPASVIASSMPTAIALGAPLELIPILLAVDTIPDMFRTIANVTSDVAVAAIVASPERPPDTQLGVKAC